MFAVGTCQPLTTWRHTTLHACRNTWGNDMTAKMVAIGVALVLVGCTYEPDIFGDRVSGDANTVAVKASYADPEPLASRHCAKYEKTAEFESVTGAWWPRSRGSNKYVYKCK